MTSHSHLKSAMHASRQQALLATRHWLPVTGYPLPAIRWPISAGRCPSPAVRCPIFAGQCPLLDALCPLPRAQYALLNTPCSIPVARHPLPRDSGAGGLRSGCCGSDLEAHVGYSRFQISFFIPTSTAKLDFLLQAGGGSLLGTGARANS